jgi:hypothetical protein
MSPRTSPSWTWSEISFKAQKVSSLRLRKTDRGERRMRARESRSRPEVPVVPRWYCLQSLSALMTAVVIVATLDHSSDRLFATREFRTYPRARRTGRQPAVYFRLAAHYPVSSATQSQDSVPFRDRTTRFDRRSSFPSMETKETEDR